MTMVCRGRESKSVDPGGRCDTKRHDGGWTTRNTYSGGDGSCKKDEEKNERRTTPNL